MQAGHERGGQHLLGAGGRRPSVRGPAAAPSMRHVDDGDRGRYTGLDQMPYLAKGGECWAFVLLPLVVFGWLLIASGIIQAIGLISARHAPNFWLQIISAILGVLLGILLLRNIAQGMLLLSLLLIIFFMIEGMSKVVFALTIRPLPNWLWVFASGVLSVVLSLVLFAAMPVTALWLIGLMLGLDLIAIGAALGAMAWRLRGQAVPAA